MDILATAKVSMMAAMSQLMVWLKTRRYSKMQRARMSVAKPAMLEESLVNEFAEERDAAENGMGHDLLSRWKI